jgi:hypothetical protein
MLTSLISSEPPCLLVNDLCQNEHQPEYIVTPMMRRRIMTLVQKGSTNVSSKNVVKSSLKSDGPRNQFEVSLTTQPYSNRVSASIIKKAGGLRRSFANDEEKALSDIFRTDEKSPRINAYATPSTHSRVVGAAEKSRYVVIAFAATNVSRTVVFKAR